MRQQVPDGLLARAHEALDVNRLHGITVPHLAMFPAAYLWDIAVITKGISVYDPRRAADEIVRFLQAQWRTGMLPNETYFESRTMRRYLFGAHPDRPAGHTSSGITQPPMIVRSALEVGRRLALQERLAFFEAVFGKLKALCVWILRERVGRNGLAVVIHPYETGMDNRIDLAEAMAVDWLTAGSYADRGSQLAMLGAVGRTRRTVGDCRRIPVGHRSSDRDVLAASLQMRHIRRLGYSLAAVDSSGRGLLVEDVGYNAVVVDAFACLQELAAEVPLPLGAGPLIEPELVLAMDQVADRLEDLWFEDPGAAASGYYSRNYRTGSFLLRPTVAGLFPLLSSRVRQRVEHLSAALVSPDKFWSLVPVPSSPLDSEGFSPNEYWRGPVWPFPVDVIETGLERQGFSEIAAELRHKYLNRPHGVVQAEYENPVTGHPLGARPFSPAAALTIRLSAYGT